MRWLKFEASLHPVAALFCGAGRPSRRQLCDKSLLDRPAQQRRQQTGRDRAPQSAVGPAESAPNNDGPCANVSGRLLLCVAARARPWPTLPVPAFTLLSQRSPRTSFSTCTSLSRARRRRVDFRRGCLLLLRALHTFFAHAVSRNDSPAPPPFPSPATAAAVILVSCPRGRERERKPTARFRPTQLAPQPRPPWPPARRPAMSSACITASGRRLERAPLASSSRVPIC